MQMQQNLSQKQVLAPKMMQSMAVLSMGLQELGSYLEALSLENPLIDMLPRSTLPGKEEEDTKRGDEARAGLDWLSDFDYGNRFYDKADAEDAASDLYGTGGSQEDELADYLLSQLLLENYSVSERNTVRYIIASLDSRGYFTESIQETAEICGVPEATVLRLLADLQDLEPAGIAARNLSECLLLQLKRKPSAQPLTETLIRDYLQDIAKDHLDIIARKLKVPVRDIRAACEEIRSMNPKPGSIFHDGTAPVYIVPDLIVKTAGDRMEVLVNHHGHPRFQTNPYYLSLANESADPEVKEYLRKKREQLETLQKDLQFRSETLYKLGNELVRRNADFFRNPKGKRAVTRLSDLADALSLHKSTISRAMSKKYLQCSRGTFPLQYFLIAPVSEKQADGTPQTQESIQEHIKEIIENEDKAHPLSDEKIRCALLSRHITIARRTVSKYREALGIPDKSGRKTPLFLHAARFNVQNSSIF